MSIYRYLTSPIFLFIIVCIIGVILRYFNLSPYHLYPDTYQNILVARNIADYRSVFGRLGEDGQWWPPFFMWTRPGYPLLILLGNSVLDDYFLSAQLISFSASVLGIGLAFLLCRAVWGSVWHGLVSAFLLAISFSHAVWSGMILTESVGVALLLAALWNFFVVLKKDSQLADWRELVTGALFGFAVITRYEYIFVVMLCLVFVLLRNVRPWNTFTNILAGVLFVVSVIFSQLFPIMASIQEILFQNRTIVIAFAVLGILIIGGSMLMKRVPRILLKRLTRVASKAFLGLILIVASLSTLQFFIPQFSFLAIEMTGLRSFFSTDILVFVFLLIGCRAMYRNRKYSELLFCFIAMSGLYYFYYRVNPTMQRYGTHLLPFMLIVCSYGGVWVWQTMQRGSVVWRSVVGVSLAGWIGLQVYITYFGMKSWSNGEYAHTSYSQEAAKIVKKYISSDSEILLVSFPESYYALTGQSTHSLALNKPFVYIPEEFDDREVLIVQDMGMRDIFPEFSRLLDEQAQAYLVGKEWIGRSYHYATRSTKESSELKVYRMRLSQVRLLVP